LSHSHHPSHVGIWLKAPLFKHQSQCHCRVPSFLDRFTSLQQGKSKSSKYGLKSGLKSKSGLEYYKSGKVGYIFQASIPLALLNCRATTIAGNVNKFCSRYFKLYYLSSIIFHQCQYWGFLQKEFMVYCNYFFALYKNFASDMLIVIVSWCSTAVSLYVIVDVNHDM